MLSYVLKRKEGHRGGSPEGGCTNPGHSQSQMRASGGTASGVVHSGASEPRAVWKQSAVVRCGPVGATCQSGQVGSRLGSSAQEA